MVAPISALLIDADDDNLALKVARCLGHQGSVTTHVLSRHDDLRIRHSRYVASYARHATGDEEWLSAIRRLVATRHIDVLVPVNEPAMRFVERHANALGALAHLHPFAPAAVFETAIDKGKLAVFLESEGIEHPHTVLLDQESGIDEALQSIEFPALVKPCRGAGGRDIHYFDTKSECSTFLHSLGERLPRYLVQRHIAGFDIDCSVLCQEGRPLAYTIQQGLVPNRVPFKAAHTIQFVHDQRVLSLVERLMGQLKWTGIAHIDLRYDNKRENLYVLEINGRYWGTLFGSLCAGVNFPYLACQAAMNKPFTLPAFRDGYFASVGAHLRHTWKNPLELAQIHRTPLCFGLADPLPELVRFTKKLRVQGM